MEIYQEWHDLGYIKQEHITHSPVDSAMGFNNGNYLMSYGGTGRIYGYVDNNMGEQADIQYLVIGDTPSVITNNYDWGRAVSAADQANVEHYLRLINWGYENEENYIKDKDYTILEDGTIERIATEDFFYGWQMQPLPYTKISGSNKSTTRASSLRTF